VAAAPGHAEAHLLRARAYAALGDRQSALSDYDEALRLAPQPDWAIERARFLGRASPASVDRALSGLEQVNARLGSIPTLHLEAIAIARASGRLDAALAYTDQLLATSGRVPQWLAMRGDLLRELHRDADARAAFSAARAAIDQLPPARRATPQMTALRARIRNQHP
jgi:tetratricopeptide (TPR) repeat protein